LGVLPAHSAALTELSDFDRMVKNPEVRMTKASNIAAGRLEPEDYDKNFSDIAPRFDQNDARVAAERCLFCYDAPCVQACPTAIDIPLFIREIAAGNPHGAAKTILTANIMGGMCGRVCPTETLCEEVCVREYAEGKPVEIGRLQRYATDVLFESGKQIFSQGTASGRRVAVVGGGPAGLACAHKLATLGHEVTVFEAREKAGGLNEYGIAAYKTVNDFAQREVNYILGVGGIRMDYGKRLGKGLKLKTLRENFDAVFLGIGLGGVNDLNEKTDVAGVMNAVDYIARLRQSQDLSKLPVGRRIVVIGGGMTAIDIASQTRRLGAEDVTIVYRRGAEQMSASDYEQELAQTDGVLIRLWMQPKKVLAKAGKLIGVEFEYTKEKNGRLVGTGEILRMPCDQLFKAIGQTLNVEDVASREDYVELEKDRIKVDEERRTSVANVWAGGDCVAGGKDLTVSAVEDGKVAALSIDRYLRSLTSATAA
jgi:glutamate synthase (NADPH/NADH) small chain